MMLNKMAEKFFKIRKFPIISKLSLSSANQNFELPVEHSVELIIT